MSLHHSLLPADDDPDDDLEDDDDAEDDEDDEEDEGDEEGYRLVQISSH